MFNIQIIASRNDVAILTIEIFLPAKILIEKRQYNDCFCVKFVNTIRNNPSN